MRDRLYHEVLARSVRARRSRLAGYVGQFERRLETTPGSQLALERLRQDVESNRTLLETFRQQSTGSRISEAAENTDLGLKVKILEAPSRPIDPVSPNRVRVVMMALILGPLLGFGAVFLAEYLDSSYRSVEDIEMELGIPVVGTIPRPAGVRSAAPARRARWVPVTLSAAVGLTAVFFVLKLTLFPELGTFQRSARAHDPGAAAAGSRVH